MGYTWDKKWIQPYESTWCTIEKFKYANSIKGSEFLEILRLDLGEKTNYTKHKVIFQDFEALKQLDRILNCKLEETHKNFLKNILGPMYNFQTVQRYFTSYLRYCPKCIEEGYHSSLHLLLFMDKCPFHDMILRNWTPAGSKYVYLDLNVSLRKIRYAFMGSGNHTLLGNTPIGDLFLSWKSKKRSSKNEEIYKSLGILNNNLIYRLYYYLFSLEEHDFYINKFIEKKEDFKRIFKLQERDFLIKGRAINKDTLFYNGIGSQGEILGKNDLASLIYVNGYKHVENHIFKQVDIIKPSNNINESYKGLNFEQYVYSNWKSDIEDKKFLEYLQYECQLFKKELYCTEELFIKIIYYIFTQMIWIHYQNWNQNILSLLKDKSKDFQRESQKIKYDMPLFVVWLKNREECYIYLL